MEKFLNATAAVALLVCATAASAETTMGIVVKIGGIPWFNAMEEGIKERAAELGISAEMIGPTSADPALQVRAIEDLIAKGVDVIGVVPNDEAALEPVLKKAMDAGVKVVAHEGPGLNNVDWNFELASADGFGEAHAKLLCQKTEEPGTFAVYVGSLTVPLHNAWADAAGGGGAVKGVPQRGGRRRARRGPLRRPGRPRKVVYPSGVSRRRPRCY